MNTNESAARSFTPWNKGQVVGQKAPLKLKDVWAIRVHLQMEQRARKLLCSTLPWTANSVVAATLSPCASVMSAMAKRLRAARNVVQQKTGHPVQFEITATTREALASWIKAEGLRGVTPTAPQLDRSDRPRTGDRHAGKGRVSLQNGLRPCFHTASAMNGRLNSMSLRLLPSDAVVRRRDSDSVRRRSRRDAKGLLE